MPVGATAVYSLHNSQCTFCRLAPEIESSFNALWAPHTTLRVTYALKSPRAKG